MGRVDLMKETKTEPNQTKRYTGRRTCENVALSSLSSTHKRPKHTQAYRHVCTHRDMYALKEVNYSSV